MNATTFDAFPAYSFPFYYSAKPSLVDGISDHHLELASPIVAYWALSIFFHVLDVSGWKWLDKYRIHESAEVQTRNRVSRTEVVGLVLVQQVIQTILGLLLLSDDVGEGTVPHGGKILAIENWISPFLHAPRGDHKTMARDVAWYIYWWGIPAAQFIFAMFIVDTWQYFLHRFMHVNKFLYRQFHSWHHRLYVPYAFGALYNHPVEGFLLDSLGALIAHLATGMTARQAALFYSFSTFKTVDDHCGYSLPFDPLQLMTSNNADYHDIHHQVVGIKSNFSQPFFVHWDAILGTRMTRQDLERRRQKQKAGIKTE